MDDRGGTWLVLINGEVREADLATLRAWASRRQIRPATRVRRVNGDWLNAGSVVDLRSIFPTEAAPLEHVEAISADIPVKGSIETGAPVAASTGVVRHSAARQQRADPGLGCTNHPDVRPRYMCVSCAARACVECVKLANGVPICSLCGELCRPFEAVQRSRSIEAEIRSGFGFRDLGIAMSFPLSDPMRLAFGTIAVMATSYVTLAGAFFLALPFAFAPNRPILLVGPVVLLLIPGGLVMAYVAHVTAGLAGGHVDEIAPDFAESFVVLVVSRTLLAGALALVTVGPYAVARYVTYVNGTHPEAVLLVCAAWAAFYLPPAIIVAGYTGSPLATLNPLFGLATMRQMGLRYIGAFVAILGLVGIEIVIVIATGRAILLAGLHLLPPVGALALAVPLGVPGFYLSLAAAGVAGRAVYTSAHRLNVRVAGRARW